MSKNNVRGASLVLHELYPMVRGSAEEKLEKALEAIANVVITRATRLVSSRGELKGHIVNAHMMRELMATDSRLGPVMAKLGIYSLSPTVGDLKRYGKCVSAQTLRKTSLAKKATKNK